MKQLKDYGTGMKSIVLKGLQQQAMRILDEQAELRDREYQLTNQLNRTICNRGKAEDPSWWYTVQSQAAELIANWRARK